MQPRYKIYHSESIGKSITPIIESTHQSIPSHILCSLPLKIHFETSETGKETGEWSRKTGENINDVSALWHEGVVYLVYNQESDKDGMEPVGSSFVSDDWCVFRTILLGRCQSVDV